MTRVKEGPRNLREGQLRGRVRKNHGTASNRSPASADLTGIMERFTQALSLVIVCHRSLAAQSSADIGDEEETLRRAIRLLKDVYNEIDVTSTAMKGNSR
jgi:hypothetical protein